MNIGYVLTEEQLQHYFSCFGTVLDVYLPRSAHRGRADYVMPACSSASAGNVSRALSANSSVTHWCVCGVSCK